MAEKTKVPHHVIDLIKRVAKHQQFSAAKLAEDSYTKFFNKLVEFEDFRLEENKVLAWEAAIAEVKNAYTIR